MTSDVAPAESRMLEEAIGRATAAGPQLRALPVSRRCAAVARAALDLSRGDTGAGRALRAHLAVTSGLSDPMIEWGLQHGVGALSGGGLEGWVQEELARFAPAIPVPPRCAGVVLAGNVFVGSLQPIVLPLLLGTPVVCKASTRDDALPRALVEALRRVDPAVGAAAQVVTFGRERMALERLLVEAVDLLIVYGSDRTVEALRARTPATTRLVEHGHGLSAAFVSASVMRSPDAARDAAERIALDVAAYDQRGCLSPVVVLGIGENETRAFAEQLHEGLARLEESLPRGPLPEDVAAMQMQWRGVAAAQGRLLTGRGHAVAHVSDAVLPSGPGYRNVIVASCTDPESAAASLAPYGVHLKCIGVASDGEALARLVGALPPPCAPRLCPAGEMQRPPLRAFGDGAATGFGLLRWMEVAVDGTTLRAALPGSTGTPPAGAAP